MAFMETVTSDLNYLEQMIVQQSFSPAVNDPAIMGAQAINDAIQSQVNTQDKIIAFISPGGAGIPILLLVGFGLAIFLATRKK